MINNQVKSVIAVLVLTIPTVFPVQAFDLGSFDLGKLDLGKLVDITKKVSTALVDTPVDKEIEIGEGVSARLLGAAHLVDEPALQIYVNKVGRWLAMQTERPDLPWHFGVIDTETVNAFATPGGNIFITNGLFKLLNNEAELAGVLAHEISHVLERHHLNAIQKQAQREAAVDLAMLLADKKNAYVDTLVNASMSLYAKGLDRDDEYAADKLGIVIASRAGYDPYGLPGVLMTLDSLQEDDEASLTFMASTHPPAADRINRLDELTAESSEQLIAGQIGEQRLQSIVK